MDSFTQKDCNFYDIINKSDWEIAPVKIDKNTLYSVWDRTEKKMLDLTFEECFALNQERYKIRKIIQMDLEGLFICEGDYIWYCDSSIGESMGEVTKDCVINTTHAAIEKNINKLCGGLVIGNTYEGLLLRKYVLKKYCIDINDIAEHFPLDSDNIRII